MTRALEAVNRPPQIQRLPSSARVHACRMHPALGSPRAPSPGIAVVRRCWISDTGLRAQHCPSLLAFWPCYWTQISHLEGCTRRCIQQAVGWFRSSGPMDGAASHAGTVLLADQPDRIGLSEHTDDLREGRFGHDPGGVDVDPAVTRSPTAQGRPPTSSRWLIRNDWTAGPRRTSTSRSDECRSALTGPSSARSVRHGPELDRPAGS